MRRLGLGRSISELEAARHRDSPSPLRCAKQLSREAGEVKAAAPGFNLAAPGRGGLRKQTGEGKSGSARIDQIERIDLRNEAGYLWTVTPLRARPSTIASCVSAFRTESENGMPPLATTA